MNNNYQQLSELIDNCLSVKSEECRIALIEKEIILEKVRKLYVQVSNFETEEYEAPAEIEKPVQKDAEKEEVSESPKKQYTQAPTLKEDIDLFFDTEHESYDASNLDEKLNEIAEEIESTASQEEPQVVVSETESADDADVFENLEEDTKIIVEEGVHDDESELFSKEEEASYEEIVIETQPQSKPAEEVATKPVQATVVQKHENKKSKPVEEPSEDDILKFAQKQKSAAKPEPKPQRSLNDLFNEHREDNSISGQYQRAKVGDLTKAISINDKFTYIRELFHNKGEDFSAAIKQLNECKNIGEAFDCLEDLKQKHFWDSSSDAYLSFCDLLRRKYS